MNPVFFPTPADLRRWFEQNHDTAQELWVGYYKKGTGKPSITWPESVDQALCFGWIDGIRKSIDDESYKIRFTPRKASSNWSTVNIKRVGQLTGLGLMQPPGLRVFEQRKGEKSGVYSFENQDKAKLPAEFEQQLRANQKAWTFFQSQPPWYQRAASWWVISAKKEETRLKRLATLINDSEHGRTIAPLTRRPKE